MSRGLLPQGFIHIPLGGRHPAPGQDAAGTFLPDEIEGLPVIEGIQKLQFFFHGQSPSTGSPQASSRALQAMTESPWASS